MSKRKSSKNWPYAVGAVVAIGFGASALDGGHYKADAAAGLQPTTTTKPSAAKQGSSGGLSKHMKDIRFCESTNNYQAVNKKSPSHTGAFQFADSTWAAYKTGYKHAKDAPASVQDAIAVKEYAKNGNSPWLDSKPCWSKR